MATEKHDPNKRTLEIFVIARGMWLPEMEPMIDAFKESLSADIEILLEASDQIERDIIMDREKQQLIAWENQIRERP